MRSTLSALQKQLLFQVALTGHRGYRPPAGPGWATEVRRLHTLQRRDLVHCPGHDVAWYITEAGALQLDKVALGVEIFCRPQPAYDPVPDRLDPQTIPTELHRLAGAWELVHKLQAEIAYLHRKQTQGEQPLSRAAEQHLFHMRALLPEAEVEWQEQIAQWRRSHTREGV